MNILLIEITQAMLPVSSIYLHPRPRRSSSSKPHLSSLWPPADESSPHSPLPHPNATIPHADLLLNPSGIPATPQPH